MNLRGLCALCGFLFVAVSLTALTPDILRSIGAVPAYVAGRFREPTGFQQSASGQYFVFDRRAHTVYGLDPQQSSAWEIIQIGGEAGRIIDPTAFASEPNGTFVVADAPNNRERIEIFTPAGFRIGRFLLPGRLKARVKIENAVLNGIGSLQYTGTSILMSQPETGALITEYELSGGVHQTFGRLRHAGHEDDPGKLKVDGDSPKVDFESAGHDYRFVFLVEEIGAPKKASGVRFLTAAKKSSGKARVMSLTQGFLVSATAAQAPLADTGLRMSIGATGVAMREWFKAVMLDFDAAQKAFERQTADLKLQKR